MRTIRRLYFYAVALISVEVILWGLITLLRTMLAQNLIFPGPDMLAQAVALVLVASPIFILHWVWIQNAAARDEEENTSMLRAVFLYGILLATLVPVTQNMLAFVDRTLIGTSGMNYERAFLGGQQTWLDNLIAIVFNAGAAAYFFRILRQNWQNLSVPGEFADIRRIYRYLWMLYGLVMTVLGAQQVLRFVFYVPGQVLGLVGRELFINGTALVIIGAPIWVYMWNLCQKALASLEEQGAVLRRLVLYVLSLSGVVTVLICAALIVDTILRRILGEALSAQELFNEIGSAFSVGLPLGAIWGYYGHWLNREFESISDLTRRAGLKRLYFYILSFLGLLATFISLNLLVNFVISSTTAAEIWDSQRTRVSGAIATILAALPLWLLTWRPMQAESFLSDDRGDHARRSLVRRSYLYLVIFICVIGGMFSAVNLVYKLLNSALGGDVSPLSETLQSVGLLVLFVLFLAYHLRVMRADGGQTASALTNMHEAFPVLVFEKENSGVAAEITAALKRVAPLIQVASQPVEQGIHEDAASARVVILPADLALDPPESLRLWLKDFTGKRIVVPGPAESWLWAGVLPRNPYLQAAQMVRTLAEGQEIRQANAPAWMILVYVFAALFALQLAFMILMLGISAFVG